MYLFSVLRWRKYCVARVLLPLDRQALVDTEILGHKIPKGTIITCLVTGRSVMSPGFEIDEKVRSPTSQQTIKGGRDRAWDPEDVTLFRPDRWMVNGDFDPTAGPQMAFGLGTRACYGKRLVYVEMRILLVLILWNFELLPCPASLSSYISQSWLSRTSHDNAMLDWGT